MIPKGVVAADLPIPSPLDISRFSGVHGVINNGADFFLFNEDPQDYIYNYQPAANRRRADVLVYGKSAGGVTLTDHFDAWIRYDGRETYDEDENHYGTSNYHIDPDPGYTSLYTQWSVIERNSFQVFLHHPDFDTESSNNRISVTQPQLNLRVAFFHSEHATKNYEFTSPTGSRLSFSTMASNGVAPVGFYGNLVVNGWVAEPLVHPGTHNRFDFRDNTQFTGPVYGRTREIYDNGAFYASYGPTPSRLRFYDTSTMRGTIDSGALGEQEFYDRSKLTTGGRWYGHGSSLMSGQQTFNHEATLHVTSSSLESPVFSSQSVQIFNDSSRLILDDNEAYFDREGIERVLFGEFLDTHLPAADLGFYDWDLYVAIGRQIFNDASSMIINGARAVNEGRLYFNDSSFMTVNIAEGIIGGTFTFAGSELRANTTGGVAGGSFTFNDGDLVINAPGAVTGGEFTFDSGGDVLINVAGGLAGGTQTFNGSRPGGVQLTVERAFNGGRQIFNNDSILSVEVGNAMNAGVQDFHGSSILRMNASGGIAQGTQFFHDQSRLEANARSSVNPIITQTFYDSSSLHANTDDAVNGGSQQFVHTSSLDVNAANGLTGGSQTFRGTSRLVALVGNGVSGGNQTFEDESRLRITEPGGVEGGSQDFHETSRLDALAWDAVQGGTQRFYGQSSLNASVHSIRSAPPILFFEESRLNAGFAFAVSGGSQTFNDTSRLDATVGFALHAGMQEFLDSSALHASAASAVTGGEQTFREASELRASFANAVSGGSQRFWNLTHLEAVTANAVSGGVQEFRENSVMFVQAPGALSGGNQTFRNSTFLAVEGVGSISGGEQWFLNAGTLLAGVAQGVTGGKQSFHDQGRLNAQATGAVSGGRQNFSQTAQLNASFEGAVTGGTQNFFDTSVLHSSARDGINGGTQNFHGSATLSATIARAVRNGIQDFNGSSTLVASIRSAVAGGVQTFNDSSRLHATGEDAVASGQQTFNDTSALNAAASYSLAGGIQTFHGSSRLNPSAFSAVFSGTQNFYGQSSLIPSAVGAVRGGIQNFYDSSFLNASGVAGRDAIEGGVQNFYDTSILAAATSNALDGGRQSFYETSVLNATGFGALNAGEQFFYDQSQLNVTGSASSGYIRGGVQIFTGNSLLNANRANGVTGGQQSMRGSSVLNANVTNAINHIGANRFLSVQDQGILNAWAANAFGTSTRVQFVSDPATQAGGTLKLNGFANQFAELIGLQADVGVIENGAANQSTTITLAGVTADSIYRGLIRDGIDSASLSLTKTGGTLWTLGGANLYSGGTSILGGGILVEHDFALGTGAVAIAAGATLSAAAARIIETPIVNHGTISGAPGGELLALRGEVSGTGSYVGALDFAGVFSPGAGIGTVTGTGNIKITGTFNIEVNGAAVDRLNVIGNLTLDGHLSVTEIGEGFPDTSLVIAESTGDLSGNLTAPAGYSIRVAGTQVILSRGESYADWAEAHAGGQAAHLDFDQDGVANGIEYFMGETGSSVTRNPALETDGATHSITWPRNPNAAASFTIQSSETLAADDWTDIVPPHAAIDESNPNEVVFTLPPGYARLFVRLSVTVDP